MKTISKVYAVLLTAGVILQYTPLLSQVRAEGQQVSPSPKPSQMPEANPNSAAGAIRDKQAVEVIVKKNPSPGPSASPKPAESMSPTPAPAPVAETPSRRQLIERNILIKRAKRLQKEYVRIRDAYGKAGISAGRIPQETPLVLRHFIEHNILDLDDLKQAHQTIRLELTEVTFKLNFPGVTPASISLGVGRDNIVILTDGRVIGVPQNQWDAGNPSTWTTFTPGSVAVVDPSNSLNPNDDQLSLLMIRDPKVSEYRIHQHFMIGPRSIWEPVLRRYGSKKPPSE